MSIDVLGAVTLFCALLCVVAPLSLGGDFHWTAPVFIVMVLGLLLLLLMWPLESWVEHSRQRLPILHLDLFRDLSFILGLTAIFFFTFSNQSFYLVLTLYLQTGLELPPLQSGLTVLPLTLAFAGVSRVAGPRAQRRGVSALIEGCGVQIVGLFLLGGAVGLFDRLSPVLTALLLIVFGAGQAMVMAPLYGLVLARVPQAHAGSGGGVVSTVQQVGNSCGVVATGLIFYAIQHSHSVRLAMGASVSLLVLALCITAAMLGTLRRHKSSDQRATSGFDLDHEFGAE